MKLANHDRAIVPEAKIVRYLLDLTHPVGRSKAVFFLRFGFTPEAWDILADALLAHASANDVTSMEVGADGTRYIIEGPLVTPDNRNPMVRVVWYIENDRDIPRFVTAYPLKVR